MSEWFETLGGLRAAMWEALDAGVRRADHPARYPTFATTTPDGWPEARTVVLRACDAVSGTVRMFTDIETSKIASLRASPRAAIHVWVPTQNLQIRLQVEVSILTGDAAESDWDSVPDHGRNSYGVTPAPGTPIPGALSYVKEPDQATFAVLQCRVVSADLVHLGADHRRARFSQDDDWVGQWLSP